MFCPSRNPGNPKIGLKQVLHYRSGHGPPRHAFVGFGGDNSVIGRSLNVDSSPRTVIGVMPQDFRFMNIDADLILPQRFDRNKIFLGNFSYQGIARLKPGVTVQQANADVGRMLGIWSPKTSIFLICPSSSPPESWRSTHGSFASAGFKAPCLSLPSLTLLDTSKPQT